MNRQFALPFSLSVVLIAGLLLTGCGNQGGNAGNNTAGLKVPQAGGRQTAPAFVGDTDFNVKEQINMPKVLFVYSDPTLHHPDG